MGAIVKAAAVLFLCMFFTPQALASRLNCTSTPTPNTRRRRVPSPRPVIPISPPPPAAATCPIDALKLGLCVDVLGGLVHIGLGDPVANTCCPVIQGLLELEAAICLCTSLRLRLLNLNIFLPLALQVLATCGLNPPPGFVCPPL